MCNSKFHPFLAALPKCEHHLHIEGTISPELLWSLAAKNNVALPSAETDAAFASPEALSRRYEAFTSLDDFLHYYLIAFRVLRTADDFRVLAETYLARVARQNVRHAEMFFDPQEHISRGVEYAVVVAGLVAAKEWAERELGMSVAIIPCLVRHRGVQDALRLVGMIREAGHFRAPAAPTSGEDERQAPAFAGWGMSGTEIGQRPGLFQEVYAAARAAGAERFTGHAGEEGPAAYVTEGLDVLGLERVDHGRRAVEDEALVARLARDNIMLTLCPLSNVALGGVPSVADMPIRKLLDAGVPFSLNSDDPAYFGGYLLENYCAVHEAFQLTVDEWAGIARNAVNGSWCNEARKRVLLDEIESVAATWRTELSG